MCMENLNAGHVSMCLQTPHADIWRHGLLKYIKGGQVLAGFS